MSNLILPPNARLDGTLSNITASVVNTRSGMGTARDKSTYNFAGAFLPFTQQERGVIHAGSFEVKRVTEKLPMHMTSKGWTVEIADGKPELVAEFDKYARRLKLQSAFKKAEFYRNLHDGAVIVLLIDDGRKPDEPVDEARIRTIHPITPKYVLDRWKVTPSDQTEEPEFYSVVQYSNVLSATGDRLSYEYADWRGQVHHTRCLRFDDGLADDWIRRLNQGWSPSVFHQFLKPFLDYFAGFQALGAMLQDASLFTYAINGLMQQILDGNEKLIRDRLTENWLATSNYGAIIHDAEHEKVGFTERNLSGWDSSLSRLENRLVAASGLPHSVLLGRAGSGGGLDGNGESEAKLMVETTTTQQENSFRDKLEYLYRLITLAKDGPTKGKEIDHTVKFNPIYTPTAQEQAELESLVIQKDVQAIGAGIYTAEDALRSHYSTNEFNPSITIDWDKKEQEFAQQQEQAAAEEAALAEQEEELPEELPAENFNLEEFELEGQTDSADRLDRQCGKGWTGTKPPGCKRNTQSKKKKETSNTNFYKLTRKEFSDLKGTVFHGTNADDFSDFAESKKGSATDQGQLGSGFYFSTDTAMGRNKKTLIPAQVDIKKPLNISFQSMQDDKTDIVNAAIGTDGLRGESLTKAIKERGYDGVILDYTPIGYPHKEVAVFDPNQITTHRKAVESAIKSGKKVPLKVLQDYPDLQPRKDSLNIDSADPHLDDLYSHISFYPPTFMRKAARRGLEMRRKFGRGGLSIQEASDQGIGSGVARARDIANGAQLSPDTIKRMHAYFSRHQKDKKKGWNDPKNPTNGFIAWNLWGDSGDGKGWRWVKDRIAQMELADRKAKERQDAEIVRFDGMEWVFDARKSSGLKVGDTKTVGDKTYVFNENRRWARQKETAAPTTEKKSRSRKKTVEVELPPAIEQKVEQVVEVAKKQGKTRKKRAEETPTSEPKQGAVAGDRLTEYEVQEGSANYNSPTYKRLKKSFDDWQKEGEKLYRADKETYSDNYGILRNVAINAAVMPDSIRAIYDKNGNLQAAASIDDTGKAIHVSYLATAPWNVKGGTPKSVKGAGIAAMEAIVQEAVTKGKPVELDALPGAVGFYQKIGFKAGKVDENVTAMKLSVKDAQKFLDGREGKSQRIPNSQPKSKSRK